jgi:hypothetical protein
MADAEPGQAKISWSRIFVILIVGAVPTTICFLLDWWWGGTLFLLLTLFAACFGFPSVLRPTVLTVFAMFAIGWLVGARLDGVLHKDDARAWWRDALIWLGGVGTGIAVPALFWFVALVASTKWVLGLDRTHDGIGWWSAFWFVALRAFGLGRPFLSVSNGELNKPTWRGLRAPPVNPEHVKQFGGPALLQVGQGNVVVLERGGQMGRILGQGSHVLERGERLEERGVHSLFGGGGDAVTVKGVRTKDGYPLDITIIGKGKLELKADTDKRPESRFADGAANSRVINEGTPLAIYEATIRQAAGGWKERYPREAENVLRKVVGRHNLDQILGVPGQAPKSEDKEQVPISKEKLAGDVKEEIGSNPSRGLVLNWIAITEIKIAEEAPADVRKAMEERWASPIRRQVLISAAETKRDELAVETEARANFITRIEDVRMEQSTKWMSIISKLGQALSEIKSPRVAAGYASVIRELLYRVGRDEQHDLMYLGQIQKILYGEGVHRADAALPVHATVIDEAVEDEDEDEV